MFTKNIDLICCILFNLVRITFYEHACIYLYIYCDLWCFFSIFSLFYQVKVDWIWLSSYQKSSFVLGIWDIMPMLGIVGVDIWPCYPLFDLILLLYKLTCLVKTIFSMCAVAFIFKIWKLFYFWLLIKNN